MPKCQFLFSAVFGFKNPTQEIFSELDETKAKPSILPRRTQRAREVPEGGQGGPTSAGGAAKKPGAPPYGVVAPGPLRGCPSAYLKPPSRKPYYREPRYEKSYGDSAAVNPISGDSEDRLRHPAGEGNHLPEDSSPPWSRPK